MDLVATDGPSKGHGAWGNTKEFDPSTVSSDEQFIRGGNYNEMESR